MFSEFRADAGGRHLATAPALDSQCKPNGGRALAVLNVGQPALGRRFQPELLGGLLEREPKFRAVRGEGHDAIGSHCLNSSSSRQVQSLAGDFSAKGSHHVNMTANARHDWYLQEWFAAAGLRQNDLVTKLDYPKNSAHRIWHGLQQYRRQEVEEISALLNIRPYELLMPPEEAMRLRRMEQVIAEVAAPAAAAAPAVLDDVEPRRRAGTSR